MAKKEKPIPAEYINGRDLNVIANRFATFVNSMAKRLPIEAGDVTLADLAALAGVMNQKVEMDFETNYGEDVG